MLRQSTPVPSILLHPLKSILRTSMFSIALAIAAAGDRSLWNLADRTAVVTGGSKGLGRAIVEELLDHGCTVLTCARDVSPLADLLSREAGGRCIAIEADVSTASGRALLVSEVEARFGARGLDVLVNNVGTNLRKASVDYTDDEYEMLHATNQASAFHLSRGCHSALKRARGCVVSVSSVSGSSNDATGAVYHMTKAALEHMTRYLACEWGPDGIRVNAVAPWFIRTPLTAPLLAQEPFHDAVRRATPLRRVGEPCEVASTVAFLAMRAAGYITGQVVGIDGGMMQEGFRYVS
ncbi:putative tropinone reductase [Emiliania huxleyi CCMP1516]|uniref:Tropinone reductase n=2 Tax=Emiliania huxleyi TaxID=2903 RepID=A0A0D3IQF8_EMIH1|nr:putative tropinone reductase [Emiliania huxleyi CCMP1516]EOD13493.1 putative tropinone reductase [Emiliania huxleyi CCMP1516]|eukprot:XP_005765922.1 putative tropinone reductase [Emiliania huxleyi CCMP1516]